MLLVLMMVACLSREAAVTMTHRSERTYLDQSINQSMNQWQSSRTKLYSSLDEQRCSVGQIKVGHSLRNLGFNTPKGPFLRAFGPLRLLAS